MNGRDTIIFTVIIRAENRFWSLNQHLLVVKLLKMLIFDIKIEIMLNVFVHILCT